jgi:acyl dehydratase
VLTLGLCVAPIALIIGKASATHLSDEIRYAAPVYAGDTLSPRFEITRLERKSRFGLVEYTGVVTNQRSERVAEIVTLMGHAYLPTDGAPSEHS